MAEWNSRRLTALLGSDVNTLRAAALRDGSLGALRQFARELLDASLEPGLQDVVDLDNCVVNLKVVTQDGNEIFFRCMTNTPLDKLRLAFCQRQGVSLNAVRFRFDGKVFHGNDTPASLGMQDHDVIDVMVEQQGD